MLEKYCFIFRLFPEGMAVCVSLSEESEYTVETCLPPLLGAEAHENSIMSPEKTMIILHRFKGLLTIPLRPLHRRLLNRRLFLSEEFLIFLCVL